MGRPKKDGQQAAERKQEDSKRAPDAFRESQMRRGSRTVLFADEELAEQVMAAIEQVLPEGQYPFQIEVAEASYGQLDVRVWNNQGVHVAMASGPIRTQSDGKSDTVAVAINTMNRALELARWLWLHQRRRRNA